MKTVPLNFDIEDHYGSIILTRLSDGADVLLQGEDGENFEAEWDKCFTATGKIRRCYGTPIANLISEDYFGYE